MVRQGVEFLTWNDTVRMDTTTGVDLAGVSMQGL